MSDDGKIDDLNANKGVTLPNGLDAIYDGGLAPLFFSREGRGSLYESERATMVRGGYSYSSSSTLRSGDYSYYNKVTASNLYPSEIGNHAAALPLRCLVSTNNR